MKQDFDISVIIAIASHHGHAIECVRSWSEKQTYPQDRFEVLLVGSGQDPQVDAQVRRLARAQDRMIDHSAITDFTLYDYGAHAAKGRILVFTEGHCIADKDCLKAIAEFIDRGHCGAALTAKGIYKSYAGALEEGFYHKQIRMCTEDGYMVRVPLRGFALTRYAFEALGGFDHQYGHFTERAVGIRLRQLGLKVEFADDARTFHYNITGPHELFEPVHDFVNGECLYRSQHTNEHCMRYLNQPSLSVEMSDYHPHLLEVERKALWSYIKDSRRAVAKPARNCARRKAIAPYLLGHMLRLSFRSMAGIWLQLPAARAAVLVNHMKTVLLSRLNAEAATDALRAFWLNSLVRYFKLEYLIKRHNWNGPAREEQFNYEIGALGDECLHGFYSVEEHGGQSFRWCKPVASVLLSLPANALAGAALAGAALAGAALAGAALAGAALAGAASQPGSDLRLEITILNVRNPSEADLKIYLNGRPLLPLDERRIDPPGSSMASIDTVSPLVYSVPASHLKAKNVLTLICNPFKSAGDARLLGMPVRTLHFAQSPRSAGLPPGQNRQTAGRPAR